MAQTINGVLYVEYFTSTGNPGEYTFENAVFNNQNDSTGNGAMVINETFVLFAPVVDINTFMPITGQVNRYKFTSLTYIDTVRISGTILFDETGEEIGVPGNGIFCMVSKASPNLRLAAPPLDDIYSDLVKGGTIAAMLNDLINILDKTNGSGTTGSIRTPEQLHVTATGQTTFNLTINPVSPETSVLYVNGVAYSYGVSNDFTISGTILTWRNTAVTLEPVDSLFLR